MNPNRILPRKQASEQASPRAFGRRFALQHCSLMPSLVASVSHQAEERKGKLIKRLKAIMLRRIKEEKLAGQLPKKSDFICVCRLSDMQYRAYMCDTP